MGKIIQFKPRGFGERGSEFLPREIGETEKKPKLVVSELHSILQTFDEISEGANEHSQESLSSGKLSIGVALAMSMPLGRERDTAIRKITEEVWSVAETIGSDLLKQEISDVLTTIYGSRRAGQILERMHIIHEINNNNPS